MKVTNVKLRKMEGQGKLKAVGSITLDDELVITDICVVDGNSGLFISMPSKKDAEGKFRNTVFPISTDFRKLITDEVLGSYAVLSGRSKEVNADE